MQILGFAALGVVSFVFRVRMPQELPCPVFRGSLHNNYLGRVAVSGRCGRGVGSGGCCVPVFWRLLVRYRSSHVHRLPGRCVRVPGVVEF
jgi:hypothetical protein